MVASWQGYLVAKRKVISYVFPSRRERTEGRGAPINLTAPEQLGCMGPSARPPGILGHMVPVVRSRQQAHQRDALPQESCRPRAQPIS